MEFRHREAVRERWFTFSLFEQLGNIGGEVHRALRSRHTDQKLFASAVDRALELFDLTLQDPRWRGGRVREIARAREVFCDAVSGGTEYNSSLEDLDRYFLQFALVARR